MVSFLIYLLKVCMASSIMVMIFRLMFRKENLLQFNRLFLLAAILIPWSLPLVTLKLPAAQAFMSLETGSMLTFIHALYDHGEVEPAIHTDHLPVFLFFLYAGGLFFFLMQLMLSFISIRSLIRKCTTRKLYGQKVFVTQKDLMPFSFLNKIVISKNAEKHPQLDLMLDHERIHVKQRHTLDIIAAEVFTAMLWFSPFAWMLARDLKTNLEYLADAGVTANSRNMAAYQATLVSFAAGFTPLLLTNGFNYTQLKKRMIMMTKTMQPGKFTWKFVLVIPLLAGLLFAFCGKETAYDIGETEKESAQIRSTGGGFSSMPDPIFFIDGRRYDDGMPELDPNEIKSVQVLKDVSAFDHVGTEEARQRGVVIIITKRSDPIFFIDGRRYDDGMPELDPNEIKSVQVLKDVSAFDYMRTEEARQRGVVIITTKNP